MLDITVEVVRKLIADQYPEWGTLPLTPVPRQGWDNRTFRLGEDLTVRFRCGAGCRASRSTTARVPWTGCGWHAISAASHRAADSQAKALAQLTAVD